MAKIVGVIPAAGSGSRLGMPFPKPLAPTITDQGIVPLYEHAVSRVRQIASEVVVIASTDNVRDVAGIGDVCLVKPEQGELPSSLALAAQGHKPDTIMAVAFPDSVWFPVAGLQRLLVRYLTEQSPIDGVLGLFQGPRDVLDEVSVDASGIVSGITPKAIYNTGTNRYFDGHNSCPLLRRGGNKWYATRFTDFVTGWGVLLATAGCLRGLTDDRPIGLQLADYRFSSVHLEGPYLDLGTPDRYIQHHDLRTAR